MKFNKNQTQHFGHLLEVQKMQFVLASVAMANDIVTSTTVDFDKEGRPFLKYKVFFTPETIAFEGDTRLDTLPYSHVLNSIDGHVVSMLFPPAKKYVKCEDEVVAISHWRRIVLSEEDVTGKIREDRGHAPMGYGKNRTQISKWAGFDAQDREICRIADGTINEGYASVISVRYEDNYNYGMVVFVDHKPESEEEQKLPTYPPRMVAKERRAEVSASFHKAAEAVGDIGDTGPRFGGRYSDGYSKATFSKPADNVKKDLPPVLTREEFDAKPESYRNEYVSIIMDLIMVMQVSLLNGLMSKVDPKFIEFIKNILGSDIVKSEWTDVFFVDGRPHENVPVPTLLAFTMNKFNVPLSLQKELFGDFHIFLTKEEKVVEEPLRDIRNVDMLFSLNEQFLEPDTFAFGTLTGVLPKVKTKEEFAKASDMEKVEYLNHVNAVAKLFNAERHNLKKENADTFEKLKDFLKNVIQSCIFEHLWRAEVVASSDADQVLTCDAFTAKAIGMNDDVYAETYGAKNVHLTKRVAAMIRAQAESEKVKSRPRTTRTKSAAVVVKTQDMTAPTPRKKPRKPEVKQ